VVKRAVVKMAAQAARWHAAVALLALLLATPAAFAGQILVFHGEARDHEDRLLYEEQHLLRQVDGQPRQRLVLYRCPSGETFARKTLRYGAQPQQPEFALVDVRFGYHEGFELGSSFVQRHADAVLRREPVSANGTLVVDAGLDEFVRAHWDALQRGEQLRFARLQPDRLAVHGFALRKLREETLYDEPVSVLRLGHTGVLGWFNDPIELGYRNRDQRLVRLQGQTGVRLDPLHYLEARLEFPPSREAAGDEGDWYEAEREPLLACALGG
jgi:hypothetical protein